jgi:hypothetical protein
MHPQLTQFRRVDSPIFSSPFGTRLVRGNSSFSRSHTGFWQVSDARAVDAAALAGVSLRLQLATIVAGVQSLLRAYAGNLMASGASLHPNYVLNRTVGDMLRSNQTISALGRLARR